MIKTYKEYLKSIKHWSIVILYLKNDFRKANLSKEYKEQTEDLIKFHQLHNFFDALYYGWTAGIYGRE